MERFDIPSELNSEVKFTKTIGLFDLMFMVIGVAIAWILDPLVYPPLIIFYYIFVLLSCLFLVSKNHKNPGKRNFQTIYLAFVRNKQVYNRI